MTISKPQVEQILKTLPIGYYINRNVSVTLTDKESSYYDPMNDAVFISYPMIANVSISLPQNETYENDIRCLLYHEIAHAFITPSKLQPTNIINVFEDERIESVLRNYFLGTNFRAFVKRVNNFHNEQPTSAFELFYQIVRYRVGPTQFLDKVSELIKIYSYLNRDTSSTYSYRYDIEALYHEIEQYFYQNQKLQQAQTNAQHNTNNDNSLTDDTNAVNDIDDVNIDDDNIDTANNTNNIEDRSNVDNETFSTDFCKNTINNIVDAYESADVSEQINKLLSSVKNVTKNNSSAINAYSGKFDPRSVIRNDYKFFVQQNRLGHVKAYSKLHFNLFIDESGSFTKNDKTVNILLKALHKFEKQNANFSFDLISCGEGQRIRAKNDRFQASFDGTHITDDIIEQYKQVQMPNAQNINICLYDGDALQTSPYYSYKDKLAHAKGFSAFNNRNSILIVDYENEQYMNAYCDKAKVILTRNYVAELQKHILQSLQMLIR